MNRTPLALSLALGLSAFSLPAQAGGLDIRIGLGHPGVVYYEPAPRYYYAPRPVYRVYERRPVVSHHRYYDHGHRRYHDHGRHHHGHHRDRYHGRDGHRRHGSDRKWRGEHYRGERRRWRDD